MANQRKQGIERVTLTLPSDLLAQIEAEAEAKGVDRLALMREVLGAYLSVPPPTSASTGAKPSKKKAASAPPQAPAQASAKGRSRAS